MHNGQNQETKKPFEKLEITEPCKNLKAYKYAKNSRGFLGRLHFMVIRAIRRKSDAPSRVQEFGWFSVSPGCQLPIYLLRQTSTCDVPAMGGVLSVSLSPENSK